MRKETIETLNAFRIALGVVFSLLAGYVLDDDMILASHTLFRKCPGRKRRRVSDYADKAAKEGFCYWRRAGWSGSRQGGRTEGPPGYRI